MSRTFVFAIRATAFTVVASDIVCIPIWALSCRPFNSYWLRLDAAWAVSHSFSCESDGPLIFWVTLVSAIQDFVVTVLPMILCWRLQVPLKQRIAVNAMFALGFFASFAGTMRLVYVYKTYYASYDVVCKLRQPQYSFSCFRLTLAQGMAFTSLHGRLEKFLWPSYVHLRPH